MTAHACPKCKELAFTWALYDDDAYTVWFCSSCNYRAEENESLEGPCIKCDDLYSIALKDGNSCYRYCTECGSNTSLEDWPETKKYNESL